MRHKIKEATAAAAAPTTKKRRGRSRKNAKPAAPNLDAPAQLDDATEDGTTSIHSNNTANDSKLNGGGWAPVVRLNDVGAAVAAVAAAQSPPRKKRGRPRKNRLPSSKGRHLQNGEEKLGEEEFLGEPPEPAKKQRVHVQYKTTGEEDKEHEDKDEEIKSPDPDERMAVVTQAEMDQAIYNNSRRRITRSRAAGGGDGDDDSTASEEEEGVVFEPSTAVGCGPAKLPHLKSTKPLEGGDCVCNWGDECVRFRKFFDREKELHGDNVFAGYFRPNISGGERQANFLDAVDRHLNVCEEIRQKSKGRYVIAYHHWPAEVMEYIKKVGGRSLLVPVSTEVAAELGINSDPKDEYRSHVEKDEYGRLRPVREVASDATEEDDEDRSWVLAPCHTYESVKAIVDEGINKEINERLAIKKVRRRQQEQEVQIHVPDDQDDEQGKPAAVEQQPNKGQEEHQEDSDETEEESEEESHHRPAAAAAALVAMQEPQAAAVSPPHNSAADLQEANERMDRLHERGLEMEQLLADKDKEIAKLKEVVEELSDKCDMMKTHLVRMVNENEEVNGGT